MSRTPYAGPKLPQFLLEKVGGPSSATKPHHRDVSRKDRRQAERQGKKSARFESAQKQSGQLRKHEKPLLKNDKPTTAPQRVVKPVKPILKKPVAVEESSSEEDVPIKPVISRALQSKLDEDDAEIAALEKKLGIKKSSKSQGADLDWLIDGGESTDDDEAPRKRTRGEDEDWLSSKRRKITSATPQLDKDGSEDGFGFSEEDEAEDSELDGLENPFSADELSDDDTDEFKLESGPKKKQVRENPYVAPIATDTSTAKYIPPSVRRAQLADSEDLSQLRRQLQGQLNRLSDTNFLSILQVVEDIYNKNARQHVTSSIITLLADIINASSTLSESFLILYAGFATAVFKVVGADFAAGLLERFTSSIDQARLEQRQGKNVLNMVAFLSNAYVLQMIGPSIMFGYIKQFLEELTEDNTELLLRIIRTAGHQLRSDDPTSLKDIVLLLTRSVSDHGEANLSVRTKFMIEVINDLKNNRMKNNAASVINAEHMTSMRKILGALSSRTLRATEPLQISLEDIRDTEKKGKWWLVGASYHDPAKLVGAQNTSREKAADDGYESETPGHVSVSKLARSQGMNTDIRRSIFAAIMSATDFEDAHQRVARLSLKNKQIAEVPRVLLHCAGAESSYNPYYTIVARRLCVDKKLQKPFQSALWNVLRMLDVGYDDESGESLSVLAVVNLGRLFGTLIAVGCLSIASLKTIEFSYPSAKLQSFTEVLLTAIMLQCNKQGDLEAAVEKVFNNAASAPRMLPGLRLFVEQTLSTATLANGSKERRVIKRGSEAALHCLSEVAQSSILLESSDEDASSEAE